MPEVVDSAATPPDPTPKRIKLTSVRGVRREMATVYADCRQGRVDPVIGSKLTYMLTSIAKVLEASDLEQRIAALEGKANSPQKAPTLTDKTDKTP
jgi:hypothetical protein